MRITNQQTTTTVMNNLAQRTRDLVSSHEKVATQKSINRPSDDPIGMGKVLDYKSTLAGIEQYQRNIDWGHSRVNISATNLEMVEGLMDEAKKIAADQANGSDAVTMQIAANQIGEIRDQLFQLANSKDGNDYMYAGNATDAPPFSMAGDGTVSYVGDNGANADMNILTSESLQVSIHANGEEIFAGAEDVFDVLKTLQDELLSGSPDLAVVTTQHQRLHSTIDQIQVIRADDASASNRLDIARNQLNVLKVNVESLLNAEEGVDLAEAIVELQNQETAYESALQSAARVFQSNLMDFLR